MAITFTCTCGKSLQVGDEFAGQEGACPSCGKAIRIPLNATTDGHITEQAPPRSPRKPTGDEPWAEPAPTVKEPPPDEEQGEMVLTTHSGTILPEEDDLFVPAPPELGRIFSVATTLKQGVEPMSLVLRIVLATVLFGLILVAGSVLLLLVAGLPRARIEEICMVPLMPAMLGAAVSAFLIWWTRFKHTCSYVGKKGAAAFECAGSRDNIRSANIFLFADAAELRTTQTRSYYNGVYTGTSYTYTWTDDKGRTIYTYSGSYRSEAGTPATGDPYYFVLVAETAWTMHLARDLEHYARDDEPLFFGLTGGDYVQVGDGYLVLMQGGRTLELNVDQIEKIVIDAGNVAIWERGAQAGWFVNQGIHQFPYGNLGNARFFMIACEKLLGIRF